jgi:hypothetical protein
MPDKGRLSFSENCARVWKLHPARYASISATMTIFPWVFEGIVSLKQPRQIRA